MFVCIEVRGGQERKAEAERKAARADTAVMTVEEGGGNLMVYDDE